jgi:hypothetical protein
LRKYESYNIRCPFDKLRVNWLSQTTADREKRDSKLLDDGRWLI